MANFQPAKIKINTDNNDATIIWIDDSYFVTEVMRFYGASLSDSIQRAKHYCQYLNGMYSSNPNFKPV